MGWIVNLCNFGSKEKIDLFEIWLQTVMAPSVIPDGSAKFDNYHIECDFSGIRYRRRLKLRILITSYSTGLW